MAVGSMKTLIGTSIYELVKYPIEDSLWFLDQASAKGANAFELFLIWSWWLGYAWEPYLIHHWKDEDGIHSPVFDLSKWNGPMWGKLNALLTRGRENKMIPIIRIHDFCSLKNRIDKRAYCFINNIQREGPPVWTGPQLSGGIWEVPVRAYYHKLHVKLLDTLHASGINRFYLVPMNEADVIRNSWTEAEARERQIDFHKWYIQDLMSLGVKKSQLIMSVSMCYDTIAKMGCRMELHGINSNERLITGPRLFPNGDGHDDKARGIADYMNWKEPSIAQAKAMAPLLKGTFGYAYINRGYQKTAVPATGEGASPRKARFDILPHLAKARV